MASPRSTRVLTNPSSVFIRSSHELFKSASASASHCSAAVESISLGGLLWTSDSVNGESVRTNSPSVRPVTISKLVATEPESWQSSEQDPWANELPAMKRVILLNT